MPRFYEVEVMSVLYGLDTMGSQERALVERLFEAFSRHPRPADCVPLAPTPSGSKPAGDKWALKWDPTIAPDAKRDEWRRRWWDPLRDEVIGFLRDSGHPFVMGRPIQWLEDVCENDATHAEAGSLFLIFDILVNIQEWIDAHIAFQEECPDGMPLPVVELTNEEAENRYRGGVARGRVV